MAGNDYRRNVPPDDDPRSAGGAGRSYGGDRGRDGAPSRSSQPPGGSRGYGSGGGYGNGNPPGNPPAGDPGDGRGYGAPPPGDRGYGRPGGRGYGGPGGQIQVGGGGRRGYGGRDGRDESGGYGRPDPDAPRIVPGERVDSPENPPTSVVGAGPRRSRSEERQDGRGGRGGGRGGRRGPGGGRSGRGPGDSGDVSGYRRVFDYPRARKSGWRKFVPSVKQVLSFTLTGFFMLVGTVAWAYATAQVPDPNTISLAQSSSYEYANQKSFYSAGTDRQNVSISDIPKIVQYAVMSAEDRGYLTEPGISVTGIVRAFKNDLTSSGGNLQGGSTITQQYVKNADLTSAQTFSRKFKEIFMAVKMSQKYSKDEILQDYLNTIYFGRGAYGIDAAAEAYFGKSVKDVTDPSEAAFLAALIQSPTQYSNAFSSDPTITPTEKQLDLTAITNRWNYVINGLVSQKWISPADGAAAKFPTPVSQATQSGLAGINGYMYEAANEWLSYEHDHGDPSAPTADQIQQGGYTVVTTFDPTLMQDAVTAVNNELWNNPSLSKNHSGLVASMSSVDPTTGDVKAFYSGSDYTTNKFLTFYDGAEQPGSSMKPFTLATAIANGIAPSSMIDGSTPFVPTDANGNQFKDQATGSAYTVHNDNNDQYGQIPITEATAFSINTAYVRLEMQVGMDKVYSTLQNVGLVRDPAVDTSYPGMTLGIWSESPLHMSEAYATFANGGTYHAPILVSEVLYDGKVVWTPKPSNTVAMTPNVAAGVTQTLQGVVTTKGGTGTEAATVSGLNNIVGKTGTTEKNQVGWFNGYTPKLATSVALWRTAPDGKSLLTLQGLNADGSPVYGGQYPTEIWGDYMKLANGYISDLTPPLPSFSTVGMTGTVAPSVTSTTPTVTKTTPPSTTTTTTHQWTPPTTTTTTTGPGGTTTTCNNFLNLGGCNTTTTTGPTGPTTGTTTTTRRGGPGG